MSGCCMLYVTMVVHSSEEQVTVGILNPGSGSRDPFPFSRVSRVRLFVRDHEVVMGPTELNPNFHPSSDLNSKL